MEKESIRKWLIVVMILANAYVWHLVGEYYFLKPKVNFLNVYEGDSALIINRSGNFLIDAGRKNYVLKPLSLILPFFERTIDVVFISHADLDHFEGLNVVLDNYKVRLMVLSDFDNNTESYQKLLRKIADKNIMVAVGKTGFEMDSKDFKVKMLYPSENDWYLSKTNEKSQILLIDTMQKKFLFTGDITDKILNQVISYWEVKNIDVLKSPHHGGKNTINESILKILNPKQAIISVGENYYGHPNQEMLSLFNNFNIEVLRTDLLGNITVK